MKINDKLEYKNIHFKNRLVMPPMATSMADEKGHITDKTLEYYEKKTASKLFSTVIVEHSYVEKRGQANKNQSSISNDTDIEGMKKLSNLIKKNKSLAILQLAHAGSLSREEITGEKPVAPSPIINPSRDSGPIPKELNIDEITDIKNKFIEVAVRANLAGFDGVEIHSAHGYLLNQFLSPLTNKREDQYGGVIYNRIRLHLDIIKGIKEKLGNSYPVFLRMGAGDFMEGGLSTEDAIKASKEFEKAGVDVLDISGGMSSYHIDDTRAGYFDLISKPIFDNVDIPLILTGGVKNGEDVIDILNREVCDLVGIGRAVLKDSNWLEREVGKYFKG